MHGYPPIPGALLWDVSPGAIDPAAHGDFLVGRVLAAGSVEDIRALRREAGDEALRAHLRRTRARRVDRRRARYLAAILDLDRAEVDAWLARPERRVWDAR